MRPRPLLLLALIGGSFLPPSAAAAPDVSGDERTLQDAKVGIDGPSLLDFLRKRHGFRERFAATANPGPRPRPSVLRCTRKGSLSAGRPGHPSPAIPAARPRFHRSGGIPPGLVLRKPHPAGRQRRASRGSGSAARGPATGRSRQGPARLSSLRRQRLGRRRSAHRSGRGRPARRQAGRSGSQGPGSSGNGPPGRCRRGPVPRRRSGASAGHSENCLRDPEAAGSPPGRPRPGRGARAASDSRPHRPAGRVAARAGLANRRGPVCPGAGDGTEGRPHR